MMYLIVVVAAVIYAAAILSGHLWSDAQRRKSVEESYASIVEEVRAERESGSETITVWSLK